MFPSKPQHRKSSRGHVLNVVPDLPDVRDYPYEPTLRTLAYPKMKPPSRGLTILDQKKEGACTGYALAAVINVLMREMKRKKGSAYVRVSPRMLYRMAQRFDEWPGEDYEGSSLRGAIRGWHNMGVCHEKSWSPNVRSNRDELTVERAIDARNYTLGAYYRLRPRLSDFHAALNETGVIFVSAQIHAGWDRPTRGKIRHDPQELGGHAFAVVGYEEAGFWVQNSWGKPWGKNGLALWSYEDWTENLMDAWVVQLAYPAPQVFGRQPRAATEGEIEVEEGKLPSPKRIEIAGHFVHIDDGKFEEQGRFFSRADEVEATAKLVAKSADYDHLLIYAHGGLNSPKASARRIRALRDGFKRNRIYPFHAMYDTGLSEEIKDILLSKFDFIRKRTGSFFDDLKRFRKKVQKEIAERSDRLMESVTRKPGTAIWDEMKRDARIAFDDSAAGTRTLEFFVDAFAASSKTGKKIHLVGHSTGAILLAHLLDATARKGIAFDLESVNLLAPACTVKLFKGSYLPRLEGGGGGAAVKKMRIYNLTEKLEEDDNVMRVYRKSLLFLVSNAFERQKAKPILGMQKFSGKLAAHAKLELIYSDPERGKRSRSASHGGFDNDRYTMNDVMRTVLGKVPQVPFTDQELAY